MYDPLRKILLFPSWFAKEFVLNLPTRGGFIDSMGKSSLQLLGRFLCALDPRGSSFMLMILTHWGICVSSTHTFHLKDLKFAYYGLRIKETQQELVLS